MEVEKAMRASSQKRRGEDGKLAEVKKATDRYCQNERVAGPRCAGRDKWHTSFYKTQLIGSIECGVCLILS